MFTKFANLFFWQPVSVDAMGISWTCIMLFVLALMGIQMMNPVLLLVFSPNISRSAIVNLVMNMGHMGVSEMIPMKLDGT